MVIEGKQVLLLVFVDFKILLESHRVQPNLEARGATVVASVVLRHKLLDSDTVGLIDDIIFVVEATALAALDL